MKKTLTILASAILALSLAGCSHDHSAMNTDRLPVGDCVNVSVDFGILAPGSSSSTECISGFKIVDGTAAALDVLKAANIYIEGTEKYGLQIVCRVNGLPTAGQPIGIKDHEDYIEECKDMPAEFGYWALLVKTPDKDWDWAQTGIADVKLVPGDSLGLVFSENSNIKFPN